MTQDKAGTDTPHMEAGESEDVGTRKSGDAARKTLALRIAHRNRLRAERLARLRLDPASADRSARRLQSQAPTAASSAAASSWPMLGPAAQMEPSRPSTSPALSWTMAGDGAAALEDLLKGLGGEAAATPEDMEPLANLEPASVLPFQRPPETDPASAGARAAMLSEPRAAPVCDLHKLEGAGPGLIWALQRAGIACLAELAALEAPELISRLGYLGRLVPAQVWIATARAGRENPSRSRC
jgi:predicted flap endonuclease-1-like 5' DNA nuclease